jgi:crotonobetainyl-CoA:carnitine CoA-transferase CaiB-like acyl-CoA transferase
LATLADGSWAADACWVVLGGRIDGEDELDRRMAEWTRGRDRFELAATLRSVGVPAAAVQRPGERIELDPGTLEWGLWPTVTHTEMGRVRVDGVPVHFSVTDWVIERGAPCLGEHNDRVFGGLLGHSEAELRRFKEDGVL